MTWFIICALALVVCWSAMVGACYGRMRYWKQRAEYWKNEAVGMEASRDRWKKIADDFQAASEKWRQLAEKNIAELDDLLQWIKRLRVSLGAPPSQKVIEVPGKEIH